MKRAVRIVMGEILVPLLVGLSVGAATLAPRVHASEVRACR